MIRINVNKSNHVNPLTVKELIVKGGVLNGTLISINNVIFQIGDVPNDRYYFYINIY